MPPKLALSGQSEQKKGDQAGAFQSGDGREEAAGLLDGQCEIMICAKNCSPFHSLAHSLLHVIGDFRRRDLTEPS